MKLIPQITFEAAEFSDRNVRLWFLLERAQVLGFVLTAAFFFAQPGLSYLPRTYSLDNKYVDAVLLNGLSSYVGYFGLGSAALGLVLAVACWRRWPKYISLATLSVIMVCQSPSYGVA